MLAGILGTAGVPALGADGVGQLVDEVMVVKTVVKSPPGVVHRRMHFRPPAHPSAHYVFAVIVPHEAQRWHINEGTLHRRIVCESGGRWWAANGPYHGVLQFHANTFARGLSTIRTRRVVLRHRRIRRIRSSVLSVWSDGHTTQHPGRFVRQRLITERWGSIRGNTTWEQIRIGAQALRGISAVRDSEWECRG